MFLFFTGHQCLAIRPSQLPRRASQTRGTNSCSFASISHSASSHTSPAHPSAGYSSTSVCTPSHSSPWRLDQWEESSPDNICSLSLPGHNTRDVMLWAQNLSKCLGEGRLRHFRYGTFAIHCSDAGLDHCCYTLSPRGPYEEYKRMVLEHTHGLFIT